MFLNLLLLRLEEPREKANRKSKGKGERSEPPEWAEEPALSKKSQEKRAGRKKHSHRKPTAEELRRPQNSEIEAEEEADLGLSQRGEQIRVTPLSHPEGQAALSLFTRCPQPRSGVDNGVAGGCFCDQLST